MWMPILFIVRSANVLSAQHSGRRGFGTVSATCAMGDGPRLLNSRAKSSSAYNVPLLSTGLL